MSIKDNEVDLNTSQKISRFLRKPFNDVRSTKPGVSVSDEEEEYWFHILLVFVKSIENILNVFLLILIIY